MSRPPHRHSLDFEIARQPDDVTCGPTCLQAVYRYYGDVASLEDVIDQVPQLDTGGTLAASLAIHALNRGYRALMYTYNLAVFDPTWFQGETPDLIEKLHAQERAKKDPRLTTATASYVEFLERGGELAMVDLSEDLLRKWLRAGRPILTGLSSTYLYSSSREVGRDQLRDDDILGVPTGHFVVLSGWDESEHRVRIADPVENHPHPDPSAQHPPARFIDWIPVQHLITAILLGVLTYDGNMLVLEPPGENE
jgi:hypothetical protein